MSNLEKKENAPAHNDGGPAFPRPISGYGKEVSGDQQGMSLRDYFAAQALQGVLMYSADISKVVAEDVCRGNKSTFVEIATRAAYFYADAMLEARMGWKKDDTQQGGCPMNCPSCGTAMTRGAPHCEGFVYQNECHRCGTIIGVSRGEEQAYRWLNRIPEPKGKTRGSEAQKS